MSVDIVIVSYNTRDLLRECLRSVVASAESVPGVRSFVVDNGSRDGSPDMVLAEFPAVQLVALEKNIGFGAGNNRGFVLGNGEYVLFLNSDAQLTDGALASLLAFAERRPQCVAVGPRLIYPDGRFQPSCRRFPSLLRNFWNASGLQARVTRGCRGLQNWLSEAEHMQGIRVDMVSGACFLIRRQYLEGLGGFDENLFLYEEEADILLPAKHRGLEVRYCAEAVVIHSSGQSVNTNDLKEFSLFHAFRSKYYCFRKHYGPGVARLTWLSDLAVYGLSAAGAALRGKQNQAKLKFAICRRAFRDSFVPLSDLRAGA